VCARPGLIQITVPLHPRRSLERTQNLRPGSPGGCRIEASARCRGGRIRVNDRHGSAVLDRRRRLAAPLGRPNHSQVTPNCRQGRPGNVAQVRRRAERLSRAATRKEWLKYWNCADCCSAQYFRLVLTTNGAGPYNHLHSARRPLTARLRASEAPHLCVDRTSEKKSEVQISSASRFAPGGWKPQGFRAV
jgi:hypothetical protein